MVAQPQLGLNFMMSQNLPSHTVGPLGGTPLVNGASQGLINTGTTDNPYAGDHLPGHERLDGGRGGSPEPRRRVHHRGRIRGQPGDEAVHRRSFASSW
jgi:hypothetical protein